MINLVEKDHPRVCGEKKAVKDYTLQQKGSPPRMRGKAETEGSARSIRGITPAYAGKSGAVLVVPGDFRDHPRVCGEKETGPGIGWYKSGSPPRMRGKAPDIQQEKPETGITPAYAGKRLHHGRFAGYPWDHPRVCGEKLLFA